MRAIEDLLLLKIVISLVVFRTECAAKLFFCILTLKLGWLIYCSLVSSNLSHKTSFATCVRLIYLDLVINKATVVWHLELQVIGPLLNMKMYPEDKC